MEVILFRELLWRLSGNLIYHVSSMKTLNNLQTNFTIESR